MSVKRVFHLYYLLLFPIFRLLFPVRFRHRERLPQGPMVLCAPHSSYLDPVFMMYLLGWDRPPRFMAKRELMDTPVLGTLLRWMGTFGVDRGRADMSAIRSAIGILRAGGIVGIFPEGTRVREEQADQSVKTGAILLASHTGAPLVPVYLPRNKRPFRRTEVVVGEPYTVPRLRGGSGALEPYAAELMARIYALKDGD